MKTVRRGTAGEDPAAFIVAVCVVTQSQGARGLPDESGEGCRGSVLGDYVEIVEEDEKFVELDFLPFHLSDDRSSGCRGGEEFRIG